MFQSLWQTLSRVVSGAAAARSVAEIARFHRIQASPGFRRAAEWVHDQLAEAGLEARLLTYPANESSSFWGTASFQEWEAREASLLLVEPPGEARKLADYRHLPLHLVTRSLAFDGEADLVVLEKGEDLVEYEGLDLHGKVVLARGGVQRVHDLAVVRGGAAGLIYDGMTESEPVRPAWSLPDTVQYTSFWWRGQKPRGFGFAVTPREGERLRRLARQHSLRVRARVNARLYDGTLDVAEAVIPGQTEEEIVLVAHLCHPQPSANDNASGAAALLEVARDLAVLINRGELEPPRRAIRFLWLPEITGSYAYLAAREADIPQMVAGLNLDMVGQDQDQCGSTLLLEGPPDALANFSAALLARLRENLLPEVKTHGGLGGYPLFRYADTPFSGGSDHYVFSDPSVGVPMPMIVQWPDRFYHTSDDTPDRVDPRMLERVACLSAAYAYWLAQAREDEARWLASEMSARFRQRVIGAAQTAITRADKDGLGRGALRTELEYKAARHVEALERLRRIAPVDVSGWKKADADFAVGEWARLADRLPERQQPVPAEAEGLEMIPRRRFRGPAAVGQAAGRLDEAGRDRWWDLEKRIADVSRALPVLAQYWANGERDVGEIGGLVRQETGQEATALLAEYFRMAADLGLVDV